MFCRQVSSLYLQPVTISITDVRTRPCIPIAMDWRTVAFALLIVALCFFIIPLRISPNSDAIADSGPSSSVDENGNNTNLDVVLFERYIDTFNKSYRHDLLEYDKRFLRFQRSLRNIETMNSLRINEKSAFYGPTEFSDMSEEEFLNLALYPDLSDRNRKHLDDPRHREHRCYRSGRIRKRSILTKPSGKIPEKVDWRTQGVVTPVRSQGACGACWAFSTVEVVESMFAIKNGTLMSLSVQEMIDCAKGSNFGCEGGDICSLLKWLLSSKSRILPESSYPLTRKTDVCKLDKTVSKNAGIRIADFSCDSFVDAEDELLVSLATHGPVAAAVNALSWQNYLGGVIQYHCDGSFLNLNHAVQIVGYDNSASVPYYIVKNSWGTLFGDKGYMYIGIGGNLCGIANQVSSVDILY